MMTTTKKKPGDKQCTNEIVSKWKLNVSHLERWITGARNERLLYLEIVIQMFQKDVQLF